MTPRRSIAWGLCLCVWLVAFFGGARSARAHPLAPLGLEVRERAGGGVLDVNLKRPLVQPRDARFSLLLPAGCTPDGPAEITIADEAALETTRVSCPGVGLVGAEIGVDGLAGAGLDAVVRVVFSDGRVVRGLVTPNAPRFRVPDAPRTFAVALGFVRLGAAHLLTGFDHLLFIVGLLFVPNARRRLVLVLTAFTVGHAVTLCAALALRVSLPRAPVEIAIALSILFVALEMRHGRRGARVRALWLGAFGFGLVHGLGFAGALADAGIPPGELPLSLASFHLGLELAQLGVVAVALVVGRLAARSVPDRPFLRRTVPACAVGGLASMWLVERVWQLAAT